MVKIGQSVAISSAISVLLLALLSQPLGGAELRSPDSSDSRVVHVIVSRGDTLLEICSIFLEDPRRCPEVTALNRLRNPDRIYPGQAIGIPVDLLRGIPAEGEVSFVSGTAEMIGPGVSGATPLRLGQKIGEGWVIQTGPEGIAEISYEDGTTVLLRSGTSIEITTSRMKAGSSVRRLFVKTGRVLSKVRKATGKAPRFEIRTPSAVTGARGTEFRIGLDDAGTTRAEVLEGAAAVQAAGREVLVAIGEGTLVEPGRQPIEPRPLLPPPGIDTAPPILNQLPAAIAFSVPAGAQSYRALLSRDPEGKETVIERVVPRSTPFVISPIPDGPYFATAQSIDSIGLEGPASEPFPVTIRVNPLPPFIEIPAGSLEFRGKQAEFRWLRVNDAVAYDLQISTDRSFVEIIAEEVRIERTLYRPKDLPPGDYAVRVRSAAADGYVGAWSDPTPFSIVPPPPAPEIGRPQLAEKDIRFTLSGITPGMTYRVQMARDQEFRDIIADRTFPSTSITLDLPKEAGVYHVRASSVDATGLEGGFSRPQSFEIERPFPLLPIVLGVGIVILLLVL